MYEGSCQLQARILECRYDVDVELHMYSPPHIVNPLEPTPPKLHDFYLTVTVTTRNLHPIAVRNGIKFTTEEPELSCDQVAKMFHAINDWVASVVKGDKK